MPSTVDRSAANRSAARPLPQKRSTTLRRHSPASKRLDRSLPQKRATTLRRYSPASKRLNNKKQRCARIGLRTRCPRLAAAPALLQFVVPFPLVRVTYLLAHYPAVVVVGGSSAPRGQRAACILRLLVFLTCLLS